jgi:putative sterol carrier protein
MVDAIIAGLDKIFKPGVFQKKTTFYFSVDDIKKTVTLDAGSCVVMDGKGAEEADCVCKTGTEMFLKIWNDGYRPGIMDFMGGKIKTNAPELLPKFLQAFGK